MPRMTKAEKQIERAYEDAYQRLGNGVQVNIMDLSKIHGESLILVKNGTSMDEAVKASLQKYRQN